MKNEKIFIIIVLLAACLSANAEDSSKKTPYKADLYVAVDGSDDWSGTLASANKEKTDGPLATLKGARNKVRDLKETNKGDITVAIRGGTYHLSETLVFGLQDSGEGNATITYNAYPEETPIFSSGRKIKGFKKVQGPLPGLPKSAEGKVYVANVAQDFKVLYDDDGMLPRARSKGFFPVKKKGMGRSQIHYPEEVIKNWSNIEDVELISRPHHAWIVNISPLVSVDEENRIAKLLIDSSYTINRLHFLKETENCWIENVLEELDEPGEWVLNTKEQKLYIWPKDESLKVIAPQLTELLRIEGDIDFMGPKDVPVKNLNFRGLTFMHGDRYQIADDDKGMQHDWDMLDKGNALVRLRGTENCVIDQCHFLHSGSGAIRVDLHGQKNTISSNHIERMGGGILVSGYGPGTKDVSKNNLVYNNHVHHVGEVYWHSPGIFIWQSGENRVANNLIHHTNYTGLIISGCMTHFMTKETGRELAGTIRREEVGDLPKEPTIEDVRPYLHTHDNVFEYNEIHNCMQKLGDGNAIYIRGAGAGNIIRRNYVHHMITPMIMQAAIRTDGGQMDTIISENLIYKCVSQGILMKLNNRCENNIVADIIAPPRGYYLSLREGPLTGATIKRNIFYSSTSTVTFIDELPIGKGRVSEDRRGRALAKASDADTDSNIYYCQESPELGDEMLASQQLSGIDANSKSVDPMFVDPANGDFRLKPGSPALAMGIISLDLSKVGLVTEPED